MHDLLFALPAKHSKQIHLNILSDVVCAHCQIITLSTIISGSWSTLLIMSDLCATIFLISHTAWSDEPTRSCSSHSLDACEARAEIICSCYIQTQEPAGVKPFAFLEVNKRNQVSLTRLIHFDLIAYRKSYVISADKIRTYILDRTISHCHMLTRMVQNISRNCGIYINIWNIKIPYNFRNV